MGTVPAVALALFCAGAAPAASPDRWAPGVADAPWAVVTSLQAWPTFDQAVPDWETVVADRDPIVRAAAAAALGRGRPAGAVRWLQELLQDESELVRPVALWALLQERDESAKAPLQRALASWASFDEWQSDPPIAPWGSLFRRAGLPAELARLRRDERVEWLSRFDGAAWVLAPLPADSGPKTVPVARLSAERSEWDADQEVRLRLELAEPGRLDLDVVGWWDLSVDPPQSRVAGTGPYLRTSEGKYALDVGVPGARQELRLGGPGVLPGTYMLARVGLGNPLFFRVRRSREAEAEAPALVAAAPRDPGAVERLGELRVRAAEPSILRLWRQATRGGVARMARRYRGSDCGMLLDPETSGPLSALARLESAAAFRELLGGAATVDIGAALAQFPPAPDVTAAATAYLRSWRSHVQQDGAPVRLEALLRWPGLRSRPAPAAPLEEIAAAFCGASPPVADPNGVLALAAIQALARVNPERATTLLVQKLRHPKPTALLLGVGASRPEPAFRQVLRRAFDILGEDGAVAPRTRAQLAAFAAPDDQPLEAASLPDETLDVWLSRVMEWGASTARLEEVLKVAGEALARQPNASRQARLAELERRRGQWDEAVRLARAALPGLPKEHEGRAHLTVALALAARGDDAEARAELTTSRAAGGGDVRQAARQGEGWVRNLETRPERPGLRIRYERVGAATLRAGSFRIESAQRLRFAVHPGSAGELVAVTPTAPLDIVGLDPRRAALLLAGGTTLAYEASRPAPLWRAETRAATRLLQVPGALLAAGPEGIRALDPDSGRQLWLDDSRLAHCQAADGSTPAVLTYVPAASHPSPSRGGAASRLRLHDPRTGALRWEVEAAEAPVACASDEALLLLVGARGVATAVRRSDGHQLWRTSSAVPAPAPGDPPPVILLAPDGPALLRLGLSLAALDRDHGHQLWRYDWPLLRGEVTPELFVVPARAETWLVASWQDWSPTRRVTLHELVRVGGAGQELDRLPAPTLVDGGRPVSSARLEGRALVLRLGIWEEVWDFAGTP